MQKIKNDLDMDFMILHKRFHENYMVLNPGKCHNVVFGDDYYFQWRKTFRYSFRQQIELCFSYYISL